MDWTEMLRCPETGNALQLDETASCLRAERSDATYPIRDGIIDFCPESRDRISVAYDRMARRYDPYMTSSSVAMKVFNRIVWGHADDPELMDKVLSLLPRSFGGVLLDVPVGTGVFTASLYRRYPNATIIGVDYSIGMLRKAQSRFHAQGVNNVHLLRADVGNLPLRDETADLVLSMNGWHAFADKHGAAAQMRRVLRREGTLVACGYVLGGGRRCDWIVRHLGVRNGFFTPPFFTADELAGQFRGFKMVRQESNAPMAWFEAQKEAEDAGGAS